MNQIILRLKISQFLIISVLISIILFAGCVSPDSSLNSQSDPNPIMKNQFLNLTEGIYSINTTVPIISGKIMTYSIERPNYTREQVSSLATNLGMSGEIRETKEAYIGNASDDGKYMFAVMKEANRISFQDFNGAPSNDLTSDEAISAVKRILGNASLFPADTTEPSVTYIMGECKLESGEMSKNCKKMVLSYPRNQNGLPVWGSTLMVTVGYQEKIIDMLMNWPDYHQYKEVSVKSPEQAFKEFQTKDLVFMGTDGSIKPEKVIVTEVSFGYSNGRGEYLQPTYLFRGYGQEGTRIEKFNPVEIIASDEVLG